MHEQRMTTAWSLACALTLTSASALAQNAPSAPPPVPAPGPQVIDAGSTVPLGMVQEAWEQGAKRAGQSSVGLREYSYAPGMTYLVYTRVGTNTAVLLDATETIESIVVGDPDLIAARTEPNSKHILYLRALAKEADTDVRVKTQTHFYTLWVRTEDEAEETTSDLNVRITAAAKTRGIPSTRGRTQQAGAQGDDKTTQPGSWHTDVLAREHKERAWLARLASGGSGVPKDLAAQYGNLDIGEFDITAMRFDLTVLASSAEAARLLSPVRVMHDNVWTWLDYEDKDARIGAINEITDETEASIGFHFAGPGQRFLVVHGVGSFTIRSGPHLVCIIRTDPDDKKRWSEVIASPERSNRLRGGTPDRIPDSIGTRAAPTEPVDTADVRIDARNDSEIERARRVLRGVAPSRADEGPYLVAVPEGVAQTVCRRLAEEGIGCAIIRELGATANEPGTQ